MKQWAEIKNDYIDETDTGEGFAEMSIDAWKTEDDSEGGKSIAKILAIKTESENVVRVIYIDNGARGDEDAQVAIQEGIQVMQEYEF